MSLDKIMSNFLLEVNSIIYENKVQDDVVMVIIGCEKYLQEYTEISQFLK